MNSIQDSTALPFLPSHRTFGERHRFGQLHRSGRALLIGLLAWGFLACSTGPASAQVALELDTGAARIWNRAGASEQFLLRPGQHPTAAVAAEAGFLIAGEDFSSGDLFFLHRTAGHTSELPTPSSRVGELRSGPVLLTAGDRLEGTAWLEGSGPESFSIFASVWNGTSWETVEKVSNSKTGPQLALSATVLADGTWLVLWAGFDGTDDDIFWSRRRDGRWSTPRRVHANNDVPDILPTVTFVGDSAYAAWSFFDGNDYRVQTARWTGEGWIPGRILSGRGPGQAAFESVGGRSFLVFSTVVPEVWNLLEFDSVGAKSRTSVVSPNREKPLVVLRNNETASLEWPWRSGVESQ